MCVLKCAGFEGFTPLDTAYRIALEFALRLLGLWEAVNVELNCTSADVYAAQASVHYHQVSFSNFRSLLVSSHTVPLLSRILPSDACKIFKQGLNIRRVLDLFVCEDKGSLTLAALHERHLMHSGGKKSFQTPNAFFLCTVLRKKLV